MPTFDPKSSNWSTFIKDLEDLVNEMGWQGQGITKLKICILGDFKIVFFIHFYQHLFKAIMKLWKIFFSNYGDAYERQVNALKLYNCKRGYDQDL